MPDDWTGSEGSEKAGEGDVENNVWKERLGRMGRKQVGDSLSRLFLSFRLLAALRLAANSCRMAATTEHPLLHPSSSPPSTPHSSLVYHHRQQHQDSLQSSSSFQQSAVSQAAAAGPIMATTTLLESAATSILPDDFRRLSIRSPNHSSNNRPQAQLFLTGISSINGINQNGDGQVLGDGERGGHPFDKSGLSINNNDDDYTGDHSISMNNMMADVEVPPDDSDLPSLMTLLSPPTASATQVACTEGEEDADDFLIFEARSPHSITHPATGVIMCATCQQLDDSFFDTTCDQCLNLLQDPEVTSIANLFAVIRQWVPQTQSRIEFLVKEVLKRGAHVDDRDGLNDMTLLHYACKSGSPGIGDINVSLRTVHLLAANGADLGLRCRWTDMTPLHQAVYFDVAPIVDYLLSITDRVYLNDSCNDYNGGSAVHIAACNLCLDSLKILLVHGANVFQRNNAGRTALDCIPDPRDVDEAEAASKSDAQNIINEMRQLLISAMSHSLKENGSCYHGPVTGKVVLQALGLAIGDRVFINGSKIGILRYCGATQFASGIWAGVELEGGDGKHNGTVQGVTYFRCHANQGVFAPINRVTKYGSRYRVFQGSPIVHRPVNYPGVNVANVTPKVETGLSSLRNKLADLMAGDRVMLTDRRKGIVRFSGETAFSPGHWFGIELEKALGKNDGSVNGVRYFQCGANHGLFATGSRILRVLRPRYRDDSDNESEFSMSMTSNSEFSLTPRTSRRVKSLRPVPVMKFGSPFKTPSLLHLNGKMDNWLTVGVNVLVHNEIGVLRYIGPVDFAEGTWFGVELRVPHGKNDGSVRGRRYFTCKANHGLIVRPKSVSVRGINGAKLLQEKESKEFSSSSSSSPTATIKSQ